MPRRSCCGGGRVIPPLPSIQIIDKVDKPQIYLALTSDKGEEIGRWLEKDRRLAVKALASVRQAGMKTGSKTEYNLVRIEVS